MINSEPKYNWTDSLIIYRAPLQLYGSVNTIVFYKCKFLNLSICKVIAKVANLNTQDVYGLFML